MPIDKHACKVVNFESLCKKHEDELAGKFLRILLNMTGFMIFWLNLQPRHCLVELGSGGQERQVQRTRVDHNDMLQSNRERVADVDFLVILLKI